MIRVDVDLYHLPNGAGFELDRLLKGPSIAKMEAALLSGFATTEGRVHVITGALKASLHPSSSSPEMSGPAPCPRPGTPVSSSWPAATARASITSGGHYFLGPGGQDFEREVRQTVWEWVTGGETPAPSEGLGWKSGGDD